MAKYLTKQLKEGFISAHGLKSQSVGVGKALQQELEPAVICIPSREAERWMPVLSSLSPFYSLWAPSPAVTSASGHCAVPLCFPRDCSV